jgi:hypothetical protein
MGSREAKIMLRRVFKREVCSEMKIFIIISYKNLKQLLITSSSNNSSTHRVQVAADILGSRKISIVGADFKGLGQSELRK